MTFSIFQSFTDKLIWLEYEPNKQDSYFLLLLLILVVSLPVMGLFWTIFESGQFIFWKISKKRNN
jgi:hypothetical protein